jgi:hypothetical protein
LKRVWRLLMRVLFLTPRRQPKEVLARLERYRAEREARMERYANAWRATWAKQEVAEIRRDRMYRVR